MWTWLIDLALRLNAPVCDADALEARGVEQLSAGLDRQAIHSFEQAIACAPSERRYVLVVIASCRARDDVRARRWWPKVPANKRGQLYQICHRCGPAPDDDPGMPC